MDVEKKLLYTLDEIIKQEKVPSWRRRGGGQKVKAGVSAVRSDRGGKRNMKNVSNIPVNRVAGRNLSVTTLPNNSQGNIGQKRKGNANLKGNRRGGLRFVNPRSRLIVKRNRRISRPVLIPVQPIPVPVSQMASTLRRPRNNALTSLARKSIARGFTATNGFLLKRNVKKGAARTTSSIGHGNNPAHANISRQKQGRTPQLNEIKISASLDNVPEPLEVQRNHLTHYSKAFSSDMFKNKRTAPLGSRFN